MAEYLPLRSHEVTEFWVVEAKLSDGSWVNYYESTADQAAALVDYEDAARLHDKPVRLVRVTETRCTYAPHNVELPAVVPAAAHPTQDGDTADGC